MNVKIELRSRLTNGILIYIFLGKLFANLWQHFGSQQNLENPVLNEPMELVILVQVTVDSTLSTRQLAIGTGVSYTSVQRVLKKYKFHPYKIRLVQELNEDDFDRRLKFCEIMSERALNNDNFPCNVFFG